MKKLPQYPIYVPSKGRADNQKTVKLLQEHGITNFFVVVEANEYKEYAKYLPKENIVKLKGSDYGTSSVARNMCIEHSKKQGYEKHWQLDDDITSIYEHKLGKPVSKDVKTILATLEEIGEENEEVQVLGIATSASFLSQGKTEMTFATSLTSIYLLTNTDIRFRLRMLVDMDYQLQVLRSGAKTLRCNNYAFVFQTPLKNKGGYYDIYSNEKVRKECLEEFLKLNPEVEPGMKKTSAGFWVLSNISKVWGKFKRQKSVAEQHWKGMPEFKQEALAPYQRVVVNLVDEQAALRFFKLIGQPFTKKTRSIWFPEVAEDKYQDKRYSDKKK
jgi:hypothetical protein